MPDQKVDGDIWIEQSRDGAWFVMGHIRSEDFIIDGPWETETGATLYMERHREWAVARHRIP